MDEQPSWKHSTLSLIALVCVVSYLVGCGVLMAAGVWLKNAQVLFKGFEGLMWAVTVFGVSYVTARGMKATNGNGKPSEVPKP